MQKQSAGLLVYRIIDGNPELLLVHPGGPYFASKDLGAWSIPKGEIEENEDPLAVAKREFKEETGFSIDGHFIALQPIVQKAGKRVYAWAVEADIAILGFRSNTFSIEWPPRSGKYREFPEVDKVEWFGEAIAREKINPAQVAFIDELVRMLYGDS